MLALSAADVSPQEAAKSVVENSTSNGKSACDMELEADIRETMEVHANFDRWAKLICPLRRRVETNVGIKSDAEIKK
jgi:hypothetical protein